MIIFEYKERIVKFILCCIIVIILMLVFVKILYKQEKVLYYNDVITSLITYNDDNTSVYVEYPVFNENTDVNNIVSADIYDYVKNFKSIDEKKQLRITYDLDYIDHFVNVEYSIENSIDNTTEYNVIIDLDSNSLVDITSIFNQDYLRNEIYKLVKDKYSEEIYNLVVEEDIKDFTYIFNNDNVKVLFNSINTKPFVYINYDLYLGKNDNTIKEQKYIAFTYDDGPSDYTDEILEVLNKYNSSATFFMHGSKIKDNASTVLKVYKSNNEIGLFSHTMNREDLFDEVNTTNVIFNEITGDKIQLYRPFYDNVEEYMLEMGLKVVTSNIDSRDWLAKDQNRVYNNIIKNACDGCIVVLHDSYETTLEATKKIIPALNKLGYSVVSVSDLMNIKKYNYNNEVISFIK